MSARNLEAALVDPVYQTPHLPFDNQRVAAYYDKKTSSIIRKYGPGPRIHFHIGLFDGRPDTDCGLDELRRRLVVSQEAMVALAAERWQVHSEFAGRLADFGCGLGGGSIYWAQHCDTDVTAITIASEHIPLIRYFTAWAGVEEQVHPRLSEASAFTTQRKYDAAVAMESSCYFDRRRWFQRLATVLRPGGVVCIEDTFLGKSQWQEPFDRYWRTRIGAVAEYIEAARAAGFVLEDDHDLTDLTTEFWRQSIAWSNNALETEEDDGERNRLRQSIKWHELFHTGWKEHGIEVRLLKFRLAR